MQEDRRLGQPLVYLVRIQKATRKFSHRASIPILSTSVWCGSIPKLELSAGFPILHIDRTFEYKSAAIANREYWLPAHSEVHMEDHAREYTNMVDFKDFHKFAVESTVHYR